MTGFTPLFRVGNKTGLLSRIIGITCALISLNVIERFTWRNRSNDRPKCVVPVKGDAKIQSIWIGDGILRPQLINKYATTRQAI